MTRPSWRCLLFAPADNAKIVESATRRGADAVILDLEDAVAPAAKPAARAALAERQATIADAGLDVVVRVNASPREMVRDLEAVDLRTLAGVMVPKCIDDRGLRVAADILVSLEAESGTSAKAILIALVESPAALSNLDLVARAPRLGALMFGSEDYAAEMGVSPSEALLTLPASLVAAAAVAAGLLPIGLVGSLADFGDLDVFAARVARSRAVGFRAAAAIHPSQVEPVKRGFAPSDAEIADARTIVEAFAAAEREGRGAVSLAGRMIDPPVRARALSTLAAAGYVP